MPSPAERPGMQSRFIVATLTAFLALGSVAFADTPSSNAAPAQVSQTPVQQTSCTPARNPAIPLAQWWTPQGIYPMSPAQFGVAMRGACSGTPDFVPSTQPFMSAYPYPQSWWLYGVYPPQQYRGT